MTSQPGLFPNISRSKDNQIMKFAQLIEYTQNTLEKLFPDPYLKN